MYGICKYPTRSSTFHDNVWVSLQREYHWLDLIFTKTDIFICSQKYGELEGQKLLSRAEFHLGAHVNKFHRLQMLPTPGSARSNRYAVLFGTLDGAIDYLAPVDELTFRRLQTLQRKLVDCVAHVAGVNPRAFRQFRCEGRAHRPGPDNIVDCELLSQ
jgi:cleavage and polyadenylation specificity factor subunit 1